MEMLKKKEWTEDDILKVCEHYAAVREAITRMEEILKRVRERLKERLDELNKDELRNEKVEVSVFEQTRKTLRSEIADALAIKKPEWFEEKRIIGIRIRSLD